MDKRFSLLLIFFIVFFLTSRVDAYTIDGDTVYFENAYGRVSQTPHTLREFTNQPEINFTSYFSSEQCVDIAFGFNTSRMRPTNAKYYKPHLVNTTKSYVCDFQESIRYNPYTDETYYCDDSYYIYSDNPKVTKKVEYFECWQDCIIYNHVSETNSSSTLLMFGHDFTDFTTNPMTALWNDTHQEDWVDVSHKFETIKETHFGRDTWYVIQDVVFQLGETKTLQPTIRVMPRVGTYYGKYDILIKRCSDTIAQAKSSGNYVHIDPWANTSKNSCRNIVIDNTGNGDALTDYQVLIKIANATNHADDFSDIEFINTTCNNGGSALDFWVENYTASTDIYAWLEVDNIPASTTRNVSYYFNNDSYSASMSNGDNTFLNAFFDDFEDSSVGSVWGSTIRNYSMENLGSYCTDDETGINIVERGGELFIEGSSAVGIMCGAGWLGDAVRSDISLNTTLGFIIEAKTTLHSIAIGGSGAGYGLEIANSSTNRVIGRYRSQSGHKIEIHEEQADAWGDVSNFVTSVFLGDHRLKLRQNGTTTKFDQDENTTTANPFAIGDSNIVLYVVTRETGDAINASYDWVFARKFTDPEPTYTIGVEQEQPAPPAWSDNTSDVQNAEHVSNFTVTWSLTPDNVLFESNIGGSSANYTMSDELGANSIYNFTRALAEGTFWYRIHANNSNEWNTTDNWTFTVSTSPIAIQQWAQVESYDDLWIDYNLTVWVFNNDTVTHHCTVTPSSNYSSAYTITVNANAVNKTIMNSNYTRPTADSNFTIVAASLSTNCSGSTEALFIIIPIDPPSAASKGAVAEEFRINDSVASTLSANADESVSLVIIDDVFSTFLQAVRYFWSFLVRGTQSTTLYVTGNPFVSSILQFASDTTSSLVHDVMRSLKIEDAVSNEEVVVFDGITRSLLFDGVVTTDGTITYEDYQSLFLQEKVTSTSTLQDVENRNLLFTNSVSSSLLQTLDGWIACSLLHDCEPDARIVVGGPSAPIHCPYNTTVDPSNNTHICIWGVRGCDWACEERQQLTLWNLNLGEVSVFKLIKDFWGVVQFLGMEEPTSYAYVKLSRGGFGVSWLGLIVLVATFVVSYVVVTKLTENNDKWRNKKYWKFSIPFIISVVSVILLFIFI